MGKSSHKPYCVSSILLPMQIDGGGWGVRGLLCRVFDRFQHSEVAGQFLAKEGCRSEKPSLLYWNLSVSPRTVTKLRISIVQYLNTAPLFWGFTNGPMPRKSHFA